MTTRFRLLIRLRPLLRFIKYRILHTDDSPQSIARGIAVGLFTAWLPFFGLHIPLALLSAAILRANKAMAILFIWISNPLTAPFIYYPSYRVGRFILGFFQSEPAMPLEHIEAIFVEILSIERIFSEFFKPELWQQIRDVFLSVGQEMLIGGLILGSIVAAFGYWVSISVITRQRTKRDHRRMELADSSI